MVPFMLKLFILLLVVPFVEFALLVKLAAAIGFWETILIQIGTAFLGATLAKLEGLRVLRAVQEQLAQNIMPSEDLMDGLMIFAGGLVLLTPGLITDFFGFFLLIPWTRQLVKQVVRRRFAAARASNTQTSVTTIFLP